MRGIRRNDTETLKGYAHAGRWLCLGGAALGALGLIGGIAGADLPMTPNAGLGLLLIGGAGALRHREDAGRAREALALLAALAVLAIGLETLAESALGIDLGPRATRPSPLTALAFTFLATALLLFDSRLTARARPSEWLVLAAGVTAFSSLLGLVFGAGLIGVSLLTAAGLLLTSVGLLLERPAIGVMRVVTSPGPGGVLLRRLGLPALVVPTLIGFAVLHALRSVGLAEPSAVVAVFVSLSTAVSLFLLTVTAVPLNRTARALESSRTRLRNLVELAPDGIFVADLDGRYTEVNGAGCRMVGYSREEIVGKTIVDLIPPGRVHQLEREKKELLAGRIQVTEWTLRRKDGTYLPVEVSAKILPDGQWQGFVRDITEQKRREREQKLLADIGAVFAATLEYEETLANIARVVVRDLADFCIVEVSEERTVRRLKVVSRDPAQAWVCDLLSAIPIDRSRPYLARAAFETERPVLVEHLTPDMLRSFAQSEEHLRALRALDPRSLMSVPLLAHGKLLGALVLVSSTESRRYGPSDLRLGEELALRAALAIENARLYRLARRAIQVRDDVLGVVAHDLRNPLGTILLQARLLRRPGGEPERRSRRPADVIDRAANRMNRLIKDLLDVAQMEAGHLSIEPGRVSAAEVISDSVDPQSTLAAAASLELRSDVPQTLPEVWADRDRLLQVFENLIGNAIKFTEPGGRITVGAAPRADEVLFWVADTGMGIAGQDLPHVFARFWQAGPAKRAGAGLGLPIAKGIVEAHGGRVWAESAPGRGSTFFFTIPTARRPEPWRPEPAPRGP